MAFQYGRLASIFYLWCLFWSCGVFSKSQVDLIADSSAVSVVAVVALASTAVISAAGLVMSLTVRKRADMLALPAVGSVMVSGLNFAYVLKFRRTVLNNFETAVQHLDRGFMLDDVDSWDRVKHLEMRFGTGIDAHFGVGHLATVRSHYMRYIGQWAASIIDGFGFSGVFMTMCAAAFTLYLAHEIHALRRIAAQPPKIQVSAYAGPQVTATTFPAAPPAQQATQHEVSV